MKTANANPDPVPEPIVMWVIYFNPTDYPGLFVTRKFVGETPTGDYAACKDLETARELPVMHGLTMVPRMEGDEPQIVEVWL